MIFAGILAGGVGSRMGSTGMPKQFLPLGEKPVVIRTLETFLRCSRFDRVYVGVHPGWLAHMESLLREHLPGAGEAVRLVSGGGDRNDTIFRIIQSIEDAYGESDDHILVTHDAVRPFVTLGMIEENIHGAIAWGAVDTVIPAADTIVVSGDGACVSAIPDRGQLYQGQTPQSFRMSLLKELYLSLSEGERRTLTDACKIFVLRSRHVHLVMGSSENMKITTAGDYRIAQALAGDMPDGNEGTWKETR